MPPLAVKTTVCLCFRAGAASSGTAHWPQNGLRGFIGSEFWAPFAERFAHWFQNRKPAELSVPQFEQRIGSPVN